MSLPVLISILIGVVYGRENLWHGEEILAGYPSLTRTYSAQSLLVRHEAGTTGPIAN